MQTLIDLRHDLHVCRNLCGWYRWFNRDPLHADQLLYHPVWGVVSYRQAAQLDIAHHDCTEHQAALGRLQK